MQRLHSKVFLAVLAIFLPLSFAIGSDINSRMPHMYLQGFAGTNVVGQGDIVAPIFLRNNKNFFLYGQARYGYAKEVWAKNPWAAALGLGYRQIVGNAAVIGAYVLGDYTQSLRGHDFWIVSPGIEALSRTWDFRANGYFPVSKRDWTTEGWGDEFGNYSYVRFAGHKQFDAWFIYHEQTGPGFDAEIGRKLFNVKDTLVKAFLNGYYFYMRDNDDVYGGGARVTIQPNTYLEISLNYTYDRYERNIFMIGAQVSIYDLFSHDIKVLDDQDLQRRLFDPIDRNFAELASGSDVRLTGGPGDGQKPEVKPSPEEPERDNIWFFDATNQPLTLANGTSVTYEDGTYENPFSAAEFNQSTIDGIRTFSVEHGHDVTFLYFNAGTYNSYTAGAPYMPIMLYSNQSMWGRTGGPKGFQQPATGSNRALFIGGLQLDGNTSLNDLQLQNYFATTGFTEGVILDGATNVMLDNIVIGANSNSLSYFLGGIDMKNGSVATITNSNVYSYSSGTGGFLLDIGINLDNSQLNVGKDNVISATATGASFPSSGSFGIGIVMSGSTVNISGANNIINADSDTSTPSPAFAEGIGISAFNSSSINITGTTTFNVGLASAPNVVYGIYAGDSNTTNNINVTGSTFNANTTSPARWGIYSATGFTPAQITVLGPPNNFFNNFVTNVGGP